MHFKYWVIFWASGTSATSMASTASMTSTASIYQKNYWAWCFYQAWHRNGLSWSLNVGWIIKNPLFHIKFCHPSELRLWRTGMLISTKSKGQCSNVHCQWTYRHILSCTFWLQRPCKCYLDYHVLSPMTLYILMPLYLMPIFLKILGLYTVG